MFGFPMIIGFNPNLKEAFLLDTNQISDTSHSFRGEFLTEGFEILTVGRFNKQERKEIGIKKKENPEVLVAKGILKLKDGTEEPHQTDIICSSQIDRRTGFVFIKTESGWRYKVKYRGLKTDS